MEEAGEVLILLSTVIVERLFPSAVVEEETECSSSVVAEAEKEIDDDHDTDSGVAAVVVAALTGFAVVAVHEETLRYCCC